MDARRRQDNHSIVNLTWNNQESILLEGGYPICGGNLSGTGERVYVFKAQNNIAEPVAENSAGRIDLIIPSKWRKEDIERMAGRYYELHRKSGLGRDLALYVIIK